MGPIQELAADLGVEERTLRRAVAQGALRAHRPGVRRIRLAAGEREYLRGHWQLISELRRALRSERGVRLAVLYGSMARGDDDADSDLDVLVSLTDGQPVARAELARRLERAAGRRADIADFALVEGHAPLLLDRVLDEGRVLVDREGLWTEQRSRRRAIRARAQRAQRRQMAAAAQAIEELTGG